MKYLTLLFLGILLSSFILTDNEYLMLYNNSNTASYFQYGNKSYLEYFLDTKDKVGEYEYYVKIRMYSWGDIDTSYYRMGDKYFYHYDKKLDKESIVIPREPKLGENWFEADSSWKYTILKTEETFKTPSVKYKNCVLVECKQLKNRDKDKSAIYYLYYSRGNGYVGNVNSGGQILSYLKETKKNAKIGTTIGGKK